MLLHCSNISQKTSMRANKLVLYTSHTITLVVIYYSTHAKWNLFLTCKHNPTDIKLTNYIRSTGYPYCTCCSIGLHQRLTATLAWITWYICCRSWWRTGLHWFCRFTALRWAFYCSFTWQDASMMRLTQFDFTLTKKQCHDKSHVIRTLVYVIE